MKKFLLLLSIVLLSGCFDSSPSKSEAKKAAQLFLRNCDYVSIDDFERVNGRKIDEQTYSVDVKYTVVVSPVGSGSKDELVKKREELTEKMQATYGEFTAAKQGVEDLVSDHKSKLVAELTELKRSIDEKIQSLDSPRAMGNSADVWAERRRFEDEIYPKRMDEITNQMKAEYDALYKEKVFPIAEKSRAIGAELAPVQAEFDLASQKFNSACKQPSSVRIDLLVFGYYNPKGSSTEIYGGFSKKIEQSFLMVKTDNGWMLK